MKTPGPQPVQRSVPRTPESNPDQVERASFNLQYRMAAAYVSAEFKGLKSSTLSIESFDIYLQRLMGDAGQPTDPIVRIMIEQLAMAHHKIGRLNRLSAEAATLEQAKVYDAASVSLLGELRRLALSIKDYQAPTPTQHVTLVKQQNVANHQQVAMVEGRPASSEAEAQQAPQKKATPGIELTSNRTLEHVPTSITIAQPAASGSRETQPIVTKRPPRRLP